jgi:Secretion system C-terminal sorting domain
MKHTQICLCLIILFGLGLNELKSQEAVLATGGEALGNGGSQSYSIGQIVYTTISGNNGSLAQGILQPYEISVVLELDKPEVMGFVCLIYPNPSTDILYLEVENKKNENLFYQLYDISGNCIKENKISADRNEIEMKNLSASIYFLKVFVDQKEIKRFKIIKK